MVNISFQDISKNFGTTKVLKNINLDIAKQEFIVLVGPSGCGKSTLLRLVAGLEEVTSGKIIIDGKEVNDLPPKDRDIAMVFQNYALYPHMTVAKNLGFSLRMNKVNPVEIKNRVAAAASTLGLTELLDRYPKQLSGGQRQRVAMGRAIVRNPKIFLFDEPLSNLDAKLRVSMRAEIKALHLRLATTSIYVTHDQSEAMTMADRIIVMNAGRIEQQGVPLELYDRPANLFVAGFIGSPAINILAATIQLNPDQTNSTPFLADCGAAGSIPLHTNPQNSVLREGLKIKVGIRPENLNLDQNGKIQGKISVVEPTGVDTLLHIQCEGQAAPLYLLCRERIGVAPGETIRLSPSKAPLIFDATSGNSIA